MWRGVAAPGFMTTLMHESSLSRNVRYIAGASSKPIRWVMMNEGSIAPRSIRSSNSGMYLCMWLNCGSCSRRRQKR